MLKEKLMVLGCVLLTVACSRTPTEEAAQPAAPAEKTAAAAPGAAPVAAPPAAKDPKQDLMQPYLSEDKIAKFIKSLAEEKNPLEFLFAQKGRAGNIQELQARVAEYNAFAQKYGFANYEEYTAVWSRIVVAQASLAAEKMKQGTAKMLAGMAEHAEQELKKPDLKPEMRKMYEEQLASSKKSLEEMKAGEKPVLHAADLALVKAHLAEIEQATAKYKNK